jgi:hypothetical protein
VDVVPSVVTGMVEAVVSGRVIIVRFASAIFALIWEKLRPW